MKWDPEIDVIRTYYDEDLYGFLIGDGDMFDGSDLTKSLFTCDIIGEDNNQPSNNEISRRKANRNLNP